MFVEPFDFCTEHVHEKHTAGKDVRLIGHFALLLKTERRRHEEKQPYLASSLKAHMTWLN